MWRKIRITNFRSIEDVEVVLAPFAVLVGPNGSGKSNFADAFVFARDIAFDASSATSRRGGILGVRRFNKTKPFDVTIEVRAAQREDGLSSDCQLHEFTLSSGADGRWAFKKERIALLQAKKPVFAVTRNGSSVQTQDNQEFDVRETTSAMLYARQLFPVRERNFLLGVRRYRLNPDLMRQPQTISESSRLEETGVNIATALRSMKEKQSARFEEVVGAMRRIVPGLEDIDVREIGRFLSLEFLQLQASGTAAFAATEMSDGALRALGIVVAAKQMQKDEFLIIEEPEANIHAGAASLLFDVLKEASKRGSVLLTTHSAELLDAARDEEILVCSYRNGVTRVGPLDEAQRGVVREGLFSLAELMRTEPLRIQGELPLTIEPTSH